MRTSHASLHPPAPARGFTEGSLLHRLSCLVLAPHFTSRQLSASCARASFFHLKKVYKRCSIIQHLRSLLAAIVLLACWFVRTVNSRSVAFVPQAFPVRPHSHSQRLATLIEEFYLPIRCPGQRFVPFVSQVRTCHRWPSKQNSRRTCQTALFCGRNAWEPLHPVRHLVQKYSTEKVGRFFEGQVLWMCEGNERHLFFKKMMQANCGFISVQVDLHGAAKATVLFFHFKRATAHHERLFYIMCLYDPAGLTLQTALIRGVHIRAHYVT